MIKYIPIILICNTTIPADSCREDNKEATVITAEPQSTPMGCLIQGQQYIAHTAIAPTLENPAYVHVKCKPREINY